MFQKISVNIGNILVNRKKTCPSLGLPTYLVGIRANLAIIKHTWTWTLVLEQGFHKCKCANGSKNIGPFSQKKKQFKL